MFDDGCTLSQLPASAAMSDDSYKLWQLNMQDQKELVRHRVTSSDALVPSSFLLLLVRHLFLVAWHLLLLDKEPRCDTRG